MTEQLNHNKQISRLQTNTRIKNSIKNVGIFKKYKRFFYLVILLTVLAGVWWVLGSKNTTLGQKELAQAKSNVSKLMLLPKDEEPTLAAVEDKNILKDPYLKTKAENGDQLLIYTKNLIVIVYRPRINKIAAVGTIDADPALSEAQGASVTVLNGTDDANKTKKIIEKVKAAYPDLNVVNGGNTNKQDFMTTIVIDNTNDKDNLVSTLSAKIGGKRGIVPVSEAKTATDIMIIVGKD